MGTSVWPAEYFKELQDIQRSDANQLIVFLASPFTPNDRYTDLHKFCHLVCEQIGKNRSINISCHRADSQSTPTVIHNDIWNYIQRSDVIIFDISERNPNVMIELGVAMAIRDKNTVIIIQDDENDEKPIFDISPSRYLKYHRGALFDQSFFTKLMNALEFSLIPAPYIPQKSISFETSKNILLTVSKNSEILLGPSNSHRRLLNDGLEFGSFYLFPYSWLTFGMQKYSNLHLKTKMRFTELRPGQQNIKGWIGINLHSQHFYAGFGHLLYVVNDGTIIYARPKDELGGLEDYEIDCLKDFNVKDWINFDIHFDDKSLGGSINSVNFNFPISEMPFCYPCGSIRFQTYQSRACINSISLEIPKNHYKKITN
jgi:hypothetical protein